MFKPSITFTKAQTNGNDFVITTNQKEHINIKLLANRRLGVGADQIVFIKHNTNNIYSIDFFNSDGSFAEMCGNGACAAAVFVNQYLKNPCQELCFNINNKKYNVKTNGIQATVFFQAPILLEQNDNNMKFISNGNKHIIYQTEQIEHITDSFAQNLQNTHKDFNIHFVQKKAEKILQMRSFERGVGWTKSCGSGAIAAAFACEFHENDQVKIVHDEGNSLVSLAHNEFALTTIPKLIFQGEFLLCQE